MDRGPRSARGPRSMKGPGFCQPAVRGPPDRALSPKLLDMFHRPVKHHLSSSDTPTQRLRKFLQNFVWSMHGAPGRLIGHSCFILTKKITNFVTAIA